MKKTGYNLKRGLSLRTSIKSRLSFQRDCIICLSVTMLFASCSEQMGCIVGPSLAHGSAVGEWMIRKRNCLVGIKSHTTFFVFNH